MTRINGELSLHSVQAGSGTPVYLLHGFPQSWREWRGVIPALADSHEVIAVDLKGAGQSSKPLSGYDKVTMAAELDQLRAELGHDRVAVVGHDIGGMVAFAWAATRPNVVAGVSIIDVPIPGMKTWVAAFAESSLWHFAFNMKRDLAETLLAGREYQYIDALVRDKVYNHGAISDAEIAHYARSMAQVGGVRGLMEWYRALPKDAEDNRAFRNDTRITQPVFAVGGDMRWGSRMVPMLEEFASNVTGGAIKDCGHWVPRSDHWSSRSFSCPSSLRSTSTAKLSTSRRPK